MIKTFLWLHKKGVPSQFGVFRNNRKIWQPSRLKSKSRWSTSNFFCPQAGMGKGLCLMAKLLGEPGCHFQAVGQLVTGSNGIDLLQVQLNVSSGFPCIFG